MKRKSERFSVGQGKEGWQYNYSDFGCVRKFDNGHIVYFFYVPWNGHHSRTYIVHVDPPDTENFLGLDYRMTIIVNFKNNKREEFSISAKTRKELFQKMREHLKLQRSALRAIPF